MKSRRLVVVSGLAASGKSTVGKALSGRLNMPLIDKDDILEALFDSLGCEDREQRYRLSRASDEVLFRLAESTDTAVLVNWWNPESAPARLRAISAAQVEVFCDCPIELAAARFSSRQRHPGHLDRRRSPEEHDEGIRRMRSTFRGPLNLSKHLVVVDTSKPVDADAMLVRVRQAIAASTW